MKFIKNHIDKTLDKWKGKEWYHQRFDACPYFANFIAEAEIEYDTEKKQGGDFTIHYSFYEDGKLDWYILIDDIKRVTNALIEKGKENPHISKDLIKNWEPQEKEFYKKCKEIEKIKLSILSDEQLIKLHDDFSEIVFKRNSSSSIIDGFALGSDELVANMIKDLYEKSAFKDKMRYAEMFSALTAPIHLSFINEAEIELVRVAIKIDQAGLRERFMNSNNIKEDLQNCYKLIEEHQKNFFWIRNNYISANILSVDDFIRDIKIIFSSHIDIVEYFNKIKKTPVKNEQLKEYLLDELKPSQELRTLLEISEDFTFWQDERKKATFFITHYGSLILDEISKRTKIPLEEIKYMNSREVSKIFEDPIPREELGARKNLCVYYYDKEGFSVEHSEKHDEVKDAILGKGVDDSVSDFRGLSAMTGKVIGKVKVVKSATEISKVDKGDILVAVMTRPDYVPAMKKAGAIITDEGGVTCHAAIIARELGIPCIIGTKIATKSLKDNQLVEVNANHGWVKLIKT